MTIHMSPKNGGIPPIGGEIGTLELQKSIEGKTKQINNATRRWQWAHSVTAIALCLYTPNQSLVINVKQFP